MSYIEMVQEIFQSNSPQVLYIGQNFTKTDEFLLQHPWSCIISSLSDFSIHEKIANESRRPTPIYNFNDAKKYIKLSTKYPCVIYLKNIDDQINNIQEKFARKKEISNILNLFPELLIDKFGSVFIFGYSNSNNDISSEHFYEFLSQLGKKSSFFFFNNLDNISNDEYLNGLENSGYSLFITEDIHNIFDELIIKDEESYTEDYIKETDIHLYINKKRISISKKSIFETKGYATLLCEEEVKTINIPSYLQTEYYQKFLQESASLPLWFGYEYNFYLQRDFEKKIIEILNDEFNISNTLDNGQPIFLYGQTCSGKTMAIRSIAYKYYVERKYPIIYISNPDINLNRDYDYFKALDHLLQELEDKGSSRTLLIWDNSPNINQTDVTMRLFNALRTRGRKFVLLVTSYVKPESKKVKTEYASIELSEIELSELKKNILSNTNIYESDFTVWSNKHQNNLLAMLYKFFKEETGNNIIQGVYAEVKWNLSNFRKLFATMSSNSKSDTHHLTQMALALQKAGFDIPDSSSVELNSDAKIEKHMFDFYVTLATFSEFNVQLPYSMALRCLTSGNEIDETIQMAIKHLSSISFIKMVETDIDKADYDFLISFRTPLEAKLFLINQEIRDEEKINHIINTISSLSIYSSNYKRNEIYIIEKIVRLVGPNSQNIFGDDPKKYFQYYPNIICALGDLRTKRNIHEPRLICQEVTLIREYYGNQNSQVGDNERIEYLKKAVELSQETINEIRSNSSDTDTIIQPLIVESVYSQLDLIDIERRIGKKDPVITFNYENIFMQLQYGISQDPNNNYPYSALFKAFLFIYDSNAINDINKIRYTSDILSLIDNVDSEYPEVTENEYYQRYKTRILQKRDKNYYHRYFDELLRNGYASAIYLEAIDMRISANIEWNRPLSIDQQISARKIIDYLDKYEQVTSNDNHCQYIKLNLKWLLYNRSPIFSEERQFTNITDIQWQEINSICTKCVTNINSRGNGTALWYEKTFYYILALSFAQLKKYRECYDILKNLTENNFNGNNRLKTWHIICDNDKPRKFPGTILPIKKYQNKYIEIKELGNRVYYHDLGSTRERQTLDDIELGLGFMGFKAFRDLEAKGI